MIKLLQINKKHHVITYTVLSILSASFILVTPYLTNLFIDDIVSNTGEKIILYALIMVLVFIINQLLFYLIDIVSGEAESNIWSKIVIKSTMNMKYYDPSFTKDANSEQNLGQSYELLKDFFLYYPVKFVVNAIFGLGVVVILFNISLINAIVISLSIPVFLVISSKYSERLSLYGDKTVQSMKKTRNYTADIWKFSFSERFKNPSFFTDVKDIIAEYRDNKRKQVKNEAFFYNVLSYAFLNLIILTTTLLSGYQVSVGLMTIGELFAVQLYVSKFWGYIEFFVDFQKEYSRSKIIIERFNTFLNIKTIDYNSEDINKICLVDYYSVDRKYERLHQTINYQFEKNKLYFVIGDNGAGKTTLILSILGLTDRYRGSINRSGKMNSDDFMYSPAVPLRTDFANKTILEGASMGELKERQLESDFLQKKSVFIFDEPSSYLDEERKDKLMKKIRNLAENNKIVIVVTHDYDLISEEDVVIKLMKGGE